MKKALGWLVKLDKAATSAALIMSKNDGGNPLDRIANQSPCNNLRLYTHIEKRLSKWADTIATRGGLARPAPVAIVSAHFR